jgi:hypothetical protein
VPDGNAGDPPLTVEVLLQGSGIVRLRQCQQEKNPCLLRAQVILGQGVTFHSLISFAAGGVLVTNGSLPAPAPFYGSWRPAGPNSFHAAFYTFIPDATGTGVATSKARIRLQLTSRNELTGTGMGYTCDAQGENCTQIESHQFKGKRILSE